VPEGTAPQKKDCVGHRTLTREPSFGYMQINEIYSDRPPIILASSVAGNCPGEDVYGGIFVLWATVETDTTGFPAHCFRSNERLNVTRRL